jgi:nitrogen fixation NifU-like protein
MMTELAKGKTVEEAKKMTRDDINKALGILPKQKYHCSILSADALQKAIADYESKR